MTSGLRYSVETGRRRYTLAARSAALASDSYRKLPYFRYIWNASTVTPQRFETVAAGTSISRTVWGLRAKAKARSLIVLGGA
jgi:hypothetical protein